MDAVIRVEGLSKRFGDLQVLQGVDVQVQAGEVVCVIGPSGSGKSTLLRCLNGLEDASGGQVWVHGTPVHDPRTDLNALRADIGMVFQRFNLFPHRTVLQNVAMAPVKVRGLTPASGARACLDLLAKVGLDRQGRRLAQPAVGRPAAARGHCPRAGHAAEGDAVRRAHVGAGPRDWWARCWP
jgi:ABC-type polar amino acid transport system ATPase subunit